jgi:diguanylate cyclase (GGDEF)-like protein/PAS domain S-box-containing protein
MSFFKKIGKFKQGLLGRMRIPVLYFARKDGKVFPVEISAGTYVSKGRRKVICSIRDITRRKKLEEKLKNKEKELQRYLFELEAYAIEVQKNEEKYRSLVESTEDSVYLLDRNLRYLYMNNKHLSRLRLSGDGYSGRSYSEFHLPEEAEWFAEKATKVFETGKSLQVETRSNAEEKYFLLTLSPVRDEEGSISALTVISKDVTELKMMERKLHDISITDELTGLYNRRGFFTLAEQRVKLATRMKKDLLLFSADLDDLKKINDRLGHHIGDMALVEAADILRMSFRESDIIGRIGGDEFVVLILQDQDVTPEVLITRLNHNLETYNANTNMRYRISISLGMASFDPKFPSSINELLVEADKLMYESKKNKKCS